MCEGVVVLVTVLWIHEQFLVNIVALYRPSALLSICTVGVLEDKERMK